MTSREIIRRTLDYDGPERVACTFGDSDIVGSGVSVETRATEWREVGGGRSERLDEWGNLWARVDAVTHGEVARGVLENLEDMDGYEFPDYSDPADYEPVRKARALHPDRWLYGGLPGFAFNIARNLRKLDQYLIDLLMEPERMHELHDRIDAMLEQMIRNYAAAGADCVFICEDWGTQDRLMISPDLWRWVFYRRFEMLCAAAHECGISVFMHSCGQIEAIVPDLIRAGVDVLQFDQPELHGIDNLASHQERGRITFWCPVDIQRTLPSCDEALIRARAREMIDKLWQGRGGFIAGQYPDNAAIGLDPKWQQAACDEFVECGVRGRYAEALR